MNCTRMGQGISYTTAVQVGLLYYGFFFNYVVNFYELATARLHKWVAGTLPVEFLRRLNTRDERTNRQNYKPTSRFIGIVLKSK